MYLRRINKKACGKNHYYWALVESYRTEHGIRQRIVGYLGDVSKKKARGIKDTVEPYYSYQQDFLSPEELPDQIEIDPKKTRTERQREFGGVWLANKLFEKLGLGDYFKQHCGSWSTLLKILVVSRLCKPSSELYISEHLYEHSAMEDFFGIPADRIYVQRLYRGLDRLLLHKEGLQQHLKDRLGSLFAITYDLFLYDITSTYFEGEHATSALCQRGCSRDSRPDCKQICIALVVTKDGLPLGYEIFAGNSHDSTTVDQIVDTMERFYGTAQRIWVMDRGMTSEANLDKLRQSGRRYIIGAPKANLKRVERRLLEKDWQIVHDGVEVKLLASPENESEVFILCKSRDRAAKEKAMHDRFIRRIEDGLEKLKIYCETHSGKDTAKKVERRVGRLLQKNSRGASFFTTGTMYDAQNDRTKLTVEKNDDVGNWKRATEGHYLLRSNITDWTPQDLWQAYIHLTDAEEAFKIHKSDLHLRPVFHQKDERIKAHVLVCFLAFVLWKTFGLMCKKSGLGDEPRRVVNEIKNVCMVDVVLTTTEGIELKIRTVPRPDRPLQILLHRLGLSLPERLTKRIL